MKALNEFALLVWCAVPSQWLQALRKRLKRAT